MPGIRLLQSAVNLRKKQQPLHGVFKRRVIRQTLNRLKNFLLGCHRRIVDLIAVGVKAKHGQEAGGKRNGLSVSSRFPMLTTSSTLKPMLL